MPRKEATQLDLKKLLKRRKTTLKRFLDDFAIATHDQLVRTCKGLGVVAPTAEEFHEASPHLVTTPTEGVAVFDPIAEDAVVFVKEKAKRQRQKNALQAIEQKKEELEEH